MNENGDSRTLLFTDFHPSTDHPAEEVIKGEGQGYSEEVLIDIDGYRLFFRIGYYDMDNKTWFLVESTDKIDLKHMRWTNLPLDHKAIQAGKKDKRRR
jgi:hypothetical protein